MRGQLINWYMNRFIVASYDVRIVETKAEIQETPNGKYTLHVALRMTILRDGEESPS